MSMAETLMSQNWEPFIQSMVQKVQTPQLNIQNAKIKTIQGQLSELSTFEKHLTDLQKIVRTLTDGSCFQERTSSVKDSDCVSITTDTNTPVGNYKVEIKSLATPSNLSGTNSILAALLPTNDLSTKLSELPLIASITEGSFTVNGTKISVTSEDTLQSVFDKLSEINVTATYNAATDKITLKGSNNIYLGAPNDTSNFLDLFRLYSNGTNETSSLTQICALNLNHPLETGNFKTAITESGSFKINGCEITYDKTDSIQRVIANINNSEAGIYIQYSPSNQSFTLFNQASGSFGISVEDVSGNLMQSLGLTQGTLTLGENAKISINNGEDIVCTSNHIKAQQHGIHGLTITAEEIGTTEFSIKENSENAIEATKKFVAKYNEIYDYLQVQTKADPKNKQFGAFYNNPEIKAFIRNFKNTVFSFSSENGVSAFSKFSSLGLNFDGNHHLNLDTTKLSSKIKDAPSEITSVFAKNSTSPMGKATDFLSTFLSKNFKTLKKTYTDQQASVQRKLDQLKRQFELQEENWRKTFDRVSEINSRMYSQLQAVNNLSNSGK